MAHRRKGSRNWARGILATFWILLAGVSGLYLFSAFNDPSLGGQLVRLSPQASGETTSSFFGSSSRDRELAEIKTSLQQLTQQVAALSAHLKLDTATPPEQAAPESEPEAAAAAPAAPTAAPAEAPTTPAQAEAPAPAEPVQPEAKPIEQAAVDARQPAAEPHPAPEAYEPPPVAVAPLEEEGPATSDVSPPPSTSAAAEAQSPAPSAPPPGPVEQPSMESAALDPIALPPAANDGSTRYGIEIGTAAKQDALRPLWREFLTNHAALVAGLQPRRVLAPDKKWRLIAGPFSSAAEAAQACALFKKASRPCEATVYAGDAL
jgi:hypothetical protein